MVSIMANSCLSVQRIMLISLQLGMLFRQNSFARCNWMNQVSECMHNLLQQSLHRQLQLPKYLIYSFVSIYNYSYVHVNVT